MIYIKRHKQFLIDKEPGKPDAKLRFRIKWSGNIVAFNVGYRVTIMNWSTETERCKNGTSNGKNKISASEINKAIQTMEDLIEGIFQKYESENKIPNAEEIRYDYNILIGKQKSVDEINTISFVFNEFINISGRENAWTKSTVAKMNTIKSHLIDCFGDISIDDLPENGMTRFMMHLQKQQMRNTTIAKDIHNLKWFFRWAKANKYCNNNFDLYNPKLKGTNGKLKTIIYLTWDELMNLYSLEITNTSLTYVRDVFCFTCFTGLRYSDVAKLRKEDVFDIYISVVTEKTDESLKIELNKYSKSILDKYKNIPLPKGLALPIISNQKMNVYLKDFAILAKLNDPVRIVYFKGNQRFEEIHPKHELITTHCGRRTFVTNALSLGIPAEVIMKWTGHSDFDSMKPYMEIMDKLKKDEMDKFSQK